MVGAGLWTRYWTIETELRGPCGPAQDHRVTRSLDCLAFLPNRAQRAAIMELGADAGRLKITFVTRSESPKAQQ